jgi:hypothetical protein
MVCRVTDGYDLKIFDREMDELDDLPRFSYSMLPDTIERYRFISYRNQPEMIYQRDSDEPHKKVIMASVTMGSLLNHTVSGFDRFFLYQSFQKPGSRAAQGNSNTRQRFFL